MFAVTKQLAVSHLAASACTPAEIVRVMNAVSPHPRRCRKGMSLSRLETSPPKARRGRIAVAAIRHCFTLPLELVSPAEGLPTATELGRCGHDRNGTLACKAGAKGAAYVGPTRGLEYRRHRRLQRRWHHGHSAARCVREHHRLARAGLQWLRRQQCELQHQHWNKLACRGHGRLQRTGNRRHHLAKR